MRVIVGLLLINVLTMIVGWAFLPWPRPELPTPASTPEPEPEADLEDVSGQQGLEDYLEKRHREGINDQDPEEDYKKTYQNYWKPLVETDGKLDLDKVMRELHDYHFMIEQVPKVYCHVSGGMISKPNTYAFEVINQHDDKRQDDIDWWVQEAIKETIETTLDEAAAHCEDVFRLRGHPKEHIDAIGRSIRDLGPGLVKKAEE